jgi:hypothetical protein
MGIRCDTTPGTRPAHGPATVTPRPKPAEAPASTTAAWHAPCMTAQTYRRLTGWLRKVSGRKVAMAGVLGRVRITLTDANGVTYVGIGPTIEAATSAALEML